MFLFYLHSKFITMALKIFRAVWFLSVLALFANLLYGYAGWPEELLIQDDSTAQVTIGKEVFFYILVIAIAVVNVMVYVIGKVYASNFDLRAWSHGLVITINIFFIIAISMVGLYNSFEKFDYQRIEFIIYGSVVLIILWSLAWPFYILFRKFFLKQAV